MNLRIAHVVWSGLAGVVVLAGCSEAGRESNGAESEDETFSWEGAVIEGDEVFWDDTPSAMAEGAEFVARGNFIASCGDRAVGDGSPAETGSVAYACVTFEIDEVMHGDDGPPGPVSVEFLGELPDGPFPTAEAVLFLVEKQGDGESGYYRSINTSGFLSALPTAQSINRSARTRAITRR